VSSAPRSFTSAYLISVLCCRFHTKRCCP